MQLFFLKLFIILLSMIIFYHYIKSFILYYSGHIAIKCKLTKLYSYEVSKGVIELPIIVISHFIFCYSLIKVTHINLSLLNIFHLSSPILIVEGAILGIGVMGAASLLGRSYIEMMRFLFPKKYSANIRNWLAMARGGWIRHHFHAIEVLPVPIALLITLGQVCAEEIIFRGVILNYFLMYGKYIALFISTSLFMMMQTFQMPNRISSIFPVIGALVLGLIGGILYMNVPVLLPLIIAHITFFAVAVL